ncbi:MAG: phosphoribosyl-AMP cyclohydrolase [Planctomycetota bacterium]|nr:phosphoribosyl-AMP cyclohydrolase [Planctomycetota bacterium]
MDKLKEAISTLKFDDAGLIPTVIVDAENKGVLMVAYMNAESLRRTIETGMTHFWSRSRSKYWMKGESSGHTQEVRAIYTDCDADTLLIEVIQHGAACHEGYRSCFYRKLTDETQWEIIAEKIFDPEAVYKKKSSP